MTRFTGVQEEWGSFVGVKRNFVEVLARQLRRPKKGTVMLASVTDAYQPPEAEYRLTRSCLVLLSRSSLQVSILTKSDLVTRDIDLLRAMPSAEVGFTVTTLHDRLAGLLEPGAVPPSRRFQALERLARSGVRTWVFVAPVIPGLTDSPEHLSSLARTARAAGALKVDFDPLNFYPPAAARLRALIARCHPRGMAAFEQACRDPSAYRQRLRALTGHL